MFSVACVKVWSLITLTSKLPSTPLRKLANQNKQYLREFPQTWPVAQLPLWVACRLWQRNIVQLIQKFSVQTYSFGKGVVLKFSAFFESILAHFISQFGKMLFNLTSCTVVRRYRVVLSRSSVYVLAICFGWTSYCARVVGCPEFTDRGHFFYIICIN